MNLVKSDRRGINMQHVREVREARALPMFLLSAVAGVLLPILLRAMSLATEATYAWGDGGSLRPALNEWAITSVVASVLAAIVSALDGKIRTILREEWSLGSLMILGMATVLFVLSIAVSVVFLHLGPPS